MQQLGHRAVQLRPPEGEVVRQDPVGRHRYRLQSHGAAGGRALPHAVPVVDHRESGGVPGHVRHMQVVVLGTGEHRDPVGEEGAGGVVLDTGQRVRAVGAGFQAGADVLDVFRPGLRLGVAEAPPGEDLAEEELPLSRTALTGDHVDVHEVALRDLGEAGVGRGQQPEDLGEGLLAYVRSPVAGGHGDREQSGFADPVQLRAGQAAFGVPFAGGGAELVGEGCGHGQGLGVVGDDFRGHVRQPAAASTGVRPRAVENWSRTWVSASMAVGVTVREPSSWAVMSLSRVNQPCTMCAAPMELSTGRRA